MPSTSPVHLLFSTCPDAISPECIVSVPLVEWLATCVPQPPGARPSDRWQRRIVHATQIPLSITTDAARPAALPARLQTLPTTTAGAPSHLAWTDAETREEPCRP